MAKREQSLGEYLVRKVGLRRAVKVCSFVVAWGIYVEKTEGPYTVFGYTDYWRQSRATSFRELDLFRIAFPAQEYPTELWSQVRAAYAEKLDAKRRDVTVTEVFSVRGAWS